MGQQVSMLPFYWLFITLLSDGHRMNGKWATNSSTSRFYNAVRLAKLWQIFLTGVRFVYLHAPDKTDPPVNSWYHETR